MGLLWLEPEVQADFVEAVAAGAVVWEGAFDLLPELGGVVHDGEVGEFVDYDVVYEGGFCHGDAPVEADAAVGGAASPTPALVAYEDLCGLLAADFGLPLGDYFWQEAGCLTAIPAFDGGAGLFCALVL